MLRTRLLCGLATVVAVLAAAPPAAHAAPAAVAFSAADVLVTAGDQTRSAELRATPAGDDPVPVTDLTVTVDVTDLAGRATVVSEPDWCTVTTTAVTCRKAAAELSGRLLGVRIVTAADAPPGTTATLTWTVSAAELPAVSTTSAVRFADRVDVANHPVGPEGRTLTAAPGGTFEIPLAVRVDSAIAAEGVVLVSSLPGRPLALTRNLAFVRRGSNCIFTDSQVACRFEQELGPGTIHDLPRSLALAVRPDAPAPDWYDYQARWHVLGDGQAAVDRLLAAGGRPGTGDPLELVERRSARSPQSDPHSGNDYAPFKLAVTGSQRAEQVAVGATVDGPVGSSATVPVGIRNTGTARADYNRSFGRVPWTSPAIDVTVPSNATITAAPATCTRAYDPADPYNTSPVGAREVRCYQTPAGFAIEPGASLTWPITFRVTAAAGTPGRVDLVRDLLDLEPTLDADRTNNSATLTATGPVPPMPTPSASVSPSASASPSATASSSTTPSPTSGSGSGSGSGGGSGIGTAATSGGGTLPRTGAPISTIAGFGAALLAAGIFLVAATRRRRPSS